MALIKVHFSKRESRHIKAARVPYDDAERYWLDKLHKESEAENHYFSDSVEQTTEK